MKRTYNQPECLVVALGTINMMAESLQIVKGNGDESNTIVASDEILTKENNNIWDEEW